MKQPNWQRRLLIALSSAVFVGGVGSVALGNAGPGNSATPFSPKLLTFALDVPGPASGQNQN